MSRRQQILAVLLARVGAIDGTGEFQTTAGQAAHLGEVPTLGPNDPPAAIALVVGDDEVAYVGGAKFVRLPIEFQAYVADVVENVYQTIEAIVADIKRAVELPDRSLGGLIGHDDMEPGPTRTLPREPGQTVVGAGLTYTVTYKEAWGAP